MSFAADVHEASRAILLGYLERAGWNITHAARDAGLNRTAMYDTMRLLGIERPMRRNCGNEAWRALQ